MGPQVGERHAFLTIKRADKADEGPYRLQLDNELGGDSVIINIAINGQPTTLVYHDHSNTDVLFIYLYFVFYFYYYYFFFNLHFILIVLFSRGLVRKLYWLKPEFIDHGWHYRILMDGFLVRNRRISHQYLQIKFIMFNTILVYKLTL